jgi:hypothetical protein
MKTEKEKVFEEMVKLLEVCGELFKDFIEDEDEIIFEDINELVTKAKKLI